MGVYRLSAAAEDDIVELLAFTERTFGAAARRRYQALLIVALRDLAADSRRAGTVARPELGHGVRSYHLSRSRDRARTEDGVVRRPRHVMLYRTIPPDIVGVGRILHDEMELSRHLPSDYGDE